MSATNMLVNISGTTLGITGSTAVQLVLLCGVSGTQVVPIQVTNQGYLLTSGIN